MRSIGAHFETRTKAQAIADRLITAVMVGAYTPGDRLPAERELAASLGVSRVTVREAIRLVSETGLLVSRRGASGGTFVTSSAWDDTNARATRRTLEAELPRLREFTDYRCLIAGLIARTAAERCTAESADALRARYREFCDAADLSAARVADARLHAQIDSMSGNDRLAALSATLTVEATLGFDSEPYPASFLERAAREHHELVDAIVGGRPDAAFDRARAHYRLTLDILEDGLRTAQAQ